MMEIWNSNPMINIKGVMIMLNRVINREDYKFIGVVILVSILACIAIAHSSDLEQDKPLFQSDDLATVLIWTGIDITKEITHIVETDNYIHKINPDLHFTTISHKVEDYKFIGVDRLALYILLRDGIWSVYNVPFDDQYNPITKLYHSMLVEFYKTGEEILDNDREEAGEFKEGMMVF